MGHSDNLKLGDWNAICDRCGFKFKASQLKEEWTGWMVCDECWEPRHPQDYLRGVPDDSSVPWSRPDSDADTDTTDINGNDIESTQTVDTYTDTGFSINLSTNPLQSTVFIATDLTANRQCNLFNLGGNANAGRRVTCYAQNLNGNTFTMTDIFSHSAQTSIDAIIVFEFLGNGAWKHISTTPLGL